MPDTTTIHETPLVSIRLDNGILHVRPTGPNIGQRESPILAKELEPFLKQAGKGLKHLVLDLQSVQFMSSMGLGLCIGWRNAAHGAGAQAVIFGMNKELKALMGMMKIDKLYKVVDTPSQLRDVCGLS